MEASEMTKRNGVDFQQNTAFTIFTHTNTQKKLNVF